MECQFLSHWYDSTPKTSRRKRDSNPGSSALEADTLTTRPTRRSLLGEYAGLQCGSLHEDAQGVFPKNTDVHEDAHGVFPKNTDVHEDVHGVFPKNTDVHEDAQGIFRRIPIIMKMRMGYFRRIPMRMKMRMGYFRRIPMCMKTHTGNFSQRIVDVVFCCWPFMSGHIHSFLTVARKCQLHLDGFSSYCFGTCKSHV